MNTVEILYLCPTCYAIVDRQAAACKCGASFDGASVLKPLPEAATGGTKLPGISFVIAQGFFFSVLFAIVTFGWNWITQTSGSSRTLGSLALWHLFRFGGGAWLPFLVLAALLRWTVLAEIHFPESKSGKTLLRWSAFLFVLQLAALLVLGPIHSLVVAPFTLGLAFLLTLVANYRIAMGVIRR